MGPAGARGRAVRSTRPVVTYAPGVRTPSARGPRAIAFYLPQFHPIPENNEWWGAGFTEWHNVVRARPLFGGHHQPHVPADLGFYDLRTPETGAAQAALAQQYGIDAFCYYHYWFNGRRLLERPFNDVLRSGEPDHKFCLCWANENWTRRWDGADAEILMGQRYNPEDDLAHIRWLCEAFADPRYIRFEGKPVLVYSASRLPDPRRTAEIWRTEAQRLGIGEIFLLRVETFAGQRGNPEDIGFDAAVEFWPDWSSDARPRQPTVVRAFRSSSDPRVRGVNPTSSTTRRSFSWRWLSRSRSTDGSAASPRRGITAPAAGPRAR